MLIVVQQKSMNVRLEFPMQISDEEKSWKIFKIIKFRSFTPYN